MPKMVLSMLGAFITHRLCVKAMHRAEQSEKWAMVVSLALLGLCGTVVIARADELRSLHEHADVLIWVLGGAFCLIQVLVGFIYLNGQRVMKELHEADKLLIIQMINAVGGKVGRTEADIIRLQEDAKHFLTEARHHELCNSRRP